MAKVTEVIEYNKEGIAIIKDTEGVYVATKHSPDIIPLSDYQAYFGRQTPCALLQSRSKMLT